MRRLILPLVSGLAATAVLIWLGVWQLQRLDWKEARIAEISNRIGDAPVALPAAPMPEQDIYLPVTVSGRFTGPEALVLTSQKFKGVGYRTIAVFETDTGRLILIDRGFLLDSARNVARPPRAATITGNLHWPDEVDSFTPPPDEAAGLWFARDVDALARALDTEATMVVARDPTGDGIEPLPVDTASIANDHFGYAMTWFSLAVVCLMMTVALVLRIRRRTA